MDDTARGSVLSRKAFIQVRVLLKVCDLVYDFFIEGVYFRTVEPDNGTVLIDQVFGEIPRWAFA